MVEVTTRYGSLTVPDTTRDVIGRFLERYGEWGWHEVVFVASILPESARVLDIGAFVGTFGLGLALRKPLASLCFVEANPAIVPMLAENVRRNAPILGTVVGAMVGGEAAEPKSGRADAENHGSASFTDDAHGAVEVEAPQRVLTLAGLRAEHGPFDLIKLDVEGMEAEILQADAEFLARGGTTLWLECNQDRRSLDLAALLLSWGLDLHYFAFPSYNRDNMRGDPSPIFPFAYEAGLLVAPRSPPVLDAELREQGCILRRICSLDDLKQALWRTPRWGMPDWAGAAPGEIVALAGHKLCDDQFDAFLQPGWKPGELLWSRLERTEQGLQSAKALAIGRLAEIEDERSRRSQAEALAAGHLKELEVERDLRRKAEAALAEASALALDRLAQIGQERARVDAEARAREAVERQAVRIGWGTRLRQRARRIAAAYRRLIRGKRSNPQKQMRRQIARAKTRGK